MIQRIQTVYLLVAAILVLVSLFLRLQWIDAMLGLSGALSLYTVFLYAKRSLQARLCLANIVLLLVWYVALAALEGQLGLVEVLPMAAAIFVFLARKGVLADEKMVRAADRLR